MKNFKKICIIMMLSVMIFSGCKDNPKNVKETSIDVSVSEQETTINSTGKAITDTKNKTLTTTVISVNERVSETTITNTIKEVPQSNIQIYEEDVITDEIPIIEYSENTTDNYKSKPEVEKEYPNDVIELPFVPAK